MQKKNIFILILILIVLISTIFFLIYFNLNKNKKEKKSVVEESLNEIIEKKDLAGCDKISEKEKIVICKDTILTTLAREKLDYSFCEKLSDKKNQDTCKTMILYDKAEKEGVAVCNNFESQEEKRNCEKEYYLTSAIQKNDANECLLLKEEKDINECQNDFLEWQKFKK